MKNNNISLAASSNVPEHAINLLARNIDDKIVSSQSIHIDIGVIDVVVAELLQKRLGRAYVGISDQKEAVDALVEEGYEAHCHNLSSEAEIKDLISSIAGKRKVGSITLLGALQGFSNGSSLLKAIAAVARIHNAFVLVSVPNILHRDIGFKLATGSISCTSSGILTDTQVSLYDERRLRHTLRSSGLHVCDSNHVYAYRSDQFFPDDHPVLQDATTIRKFLTAVRMQVDEHDQVSHFVVAALAAEPILENQLLLDKDTERPFLSIVTRTQGFRPHTLVEYFTCLAGQSCTDFEVLLVGHRLSPDRELSVKRVIEDLPIWLQEKVRLIKVDQGNRTRPLNVGFANARGRYIAIHDDDDIPMGHWVESFKELAKNNDGCLLRCVSVLQHVSAVAVRDATGVCATGRPNKVYPAEFDYFQHLSGNYSPNNTIAFPSGVYHRLGMTFDENLSTTEDWDYILRVAFLVGVATSPEITGIYQWWENSNSKTVHSHDEWYANQLRIQQKLNSSSLLLPPGSVKKLIELIERPSTFTGLRSHHADNQEALRDVILILSSTSWRLAAIFRLPGKLLLNHKEIRILDCLDKTDIELREIQQELYSSRSWRITKPVRQLKDWLR